MDGNFLPMAVHEEYAKRMDDEHKRQNELTTSVASLAKSVEQMAKAQEKQGKRLEALEQKPAKKWESFVDKVVWAVAAALITFALSRLGIT